LGHPARERVGFGCANRNKTPPGFQLELPLKGNYTCAIKEKLCKIAEDGRFHHHPGAVDDAFSPGLGVIFFLAINWIGMRKEVVAL
jgi:hypothetical protein